MGTLALTVWIVPPSSTTWITAAPKVRDKRAADRKMIKTIDHFGKNKTMTEKIVKKKTMQAKKKLNM